MCPPDGDVRWLPALLASASLLGACQPASNRESRGELRVAAAADLSLAFVDLGKAFEARTGQPVSFSFGASGVLSQQLAQGAPFDLFAAANAAFVDKAILSGACDGASKARYALGHLAIWSPRGSGVAAPEAVRDLAEPRFQRIAIANPEHAPYGKAAREAMMKAGIWELVRPRLVYGENVRQTLQLARTGNVEAAILAASLLVGDTLGTTTHVDASMHSPLEQTLVVCRRGSNAEGARALARFVASPEGRTILKRYGFGVAED